MTTVGFVGYGRFGACLGRRFLEAGIPVRAFDPANPPAGDVAGDSTSDVAGACDTIILATPVAATGDALRTLEPDLAARHLILDVGSVKTGPMAVMAEVLGRRIRFAGAHPLFGPISIAREERPLRVVVCSHPLHPSAGRQAAALFESAGCEPLEMDAAAHDEIMAESHAITYFLAKGILDAKLRIDSHLAPPSARAVARAVEAVREDAGHLFVSLHRDNPYSADARARLLASLNAADEALRRLPPDAASGAPGAEALGIPDLPEESSILREVRDQIDELDDQLLVLLARRARAALRAAAAKSELQRPVIDLRREAVLLKARRARAADLGLDPDAVQRVFDAILRFSRHVQSSGAPDRPDARLANP